MTKIRVYELAKELEMESKDVIRRLGKMGTEAKNHMSTVDDKHADMLRDIMRPRLILAEREKAAEKEKAVAAPAPPPKTEAAPAKAAAATPAEPAAEPKAAAPEKPAAPAEPPAAKAEAKPEVKPEKIETETEAAPKAAAAAPPVPPKEAAPKAEAPRQQGVFSKPAQSAQPRQTGVFQQQPRPDQARQQGVFAKPAQGGQARQQGNYQNRTPGQAQPRQQGNYQNRTPGQGQPRQQGNFQNRTPGQGQPRQQGNYQNRTPGQGQTQGQPRQQGNFQNRGPAQGGQYQNRGPAQGGGQYQNRGPGQGGQYQNRGPAQGGGQYQNRGPGQGQTQGQGAGAPRRDNKPFTAPSGETARPQEKKDPRRFDQKKKTPYDNKKKDGDNRRFDSNPHRRPPQKQKRGRMQPKEEMPAVVPKTVVIGDSVIISELAKSMSKTAAEVIKKLMSLGIMATLNQEIDAETATILAAEFGITVEVKVDKAMEMLVDDVDDEAKLVERPPVVTVMGHVDHGKTSLLDAIRSTNVIASEAGGITQHIGAYQVEINGRKITFLDTPGHEAFTSMRARGAQVTDIAVLVVAADDGVMPQTIEAINHAKAAKVPIIIAINKIDKPGANPEKIRQELTEYELVDEAWCGNTIMVPVSAKKQEGIQNLLEMILLVAEVGELKSDPDRNARGTVIEAQLDKGRGAVATLLVQKGTLKIGDILVAGTEFAKVRAMVDDKGRRIKAAPPSTPVEILGFSDVPPPGEVFVVVDDEKDARHIAGHNALAQREKDMSKSSKVTLDDLFKQISEGVVKDLNIVVKADVQGSIEALCQSIANLSTDEVRVNIIHSGVGAVAESDVMLAAASNALIIGFNVRPNANTKKAAEAEGIDIRMYRVIYEALDDIKAAMTGLLDPEFKEVIIGQVEVRDVIKVPKIGLVAGGYVLDGKVTRNAKVRLLRNGIVVHEGEISSLRRFKDDVKEVAQGYECGICIENFNDVKVEDQMEIYIMEETKRAL